MGGDGCERADGESGFFNYAVHCDASVRADGGTGCTPYAGFRGDILGVVITTVVDILGLKLEHIAWASHYTEVTSFAPLSVYVHSTCNFCHS